MENRNALLAKFWALWEHRSRKDNISWKEFMKVFEISEHFELTLDNEIEKQEGPLSLFDITTEVEATPITKRAVNIEESLAKDGIKSIIKDDFKNFKALKDVKGANWFFYKGDIELLRNPKEEFVSVIGSRKTDDHWREWIRDFLPKDKIVISGLATGADVLGHKTAIEYKQKIVVFPGIDILGLKYPSQPLKQEIINYALFGNGLLISDVFPGSKNFDNSLFLRRNRWMAQMSNETYVVYFNGVSGTLGQMVETLKLDRKIYLPKKVWELNQEFLDHHKSFANWREKIEVK